jgi:hypothetical protein
MKVRCDPCPIPFKNENSKKRIYNHDALGQVEAVPLQKRTMGSLGHASDASAEGDTHSNASTVCAFSESNSPPASPLAALLKVRCEMSGSSYAMFWERSTRGGVPVLTVAGGYVTPARKASLVRMGMSDSYPDACRDVVLDEAGDNMVAKALRSKEAIHIENVATCPSFVRRDKAARFGIQSITFLATAGGVIEYGMVHILKVPSK